MGALDGLGSVAPDGSGCEIEVVDSTGRGDEPRFVSAWPAGEAWLISFLSEPGSEEGLSTYSFTASLGVSLPEVAGAGSLLLWGDGDGNGKDERSSFR